MKETSQCLMNIFFFPGVHTVERTSTSGEEGAKESPRKRIFKHPKSKQENRER